MGTFAAAVDRAAARLTDLTDREPGAAGLLARARDEALPYSERTAALRLLGAVAGEALWGPRIVQLDVVGTCESNCVYCRDHSPYVTGREAWRYAEMPFDLAAALIRQATDLGAELIPVVGGGENLHHSRFAELIDLLKRQPARFEIYTNGLSWTDATIDLFADAPRALVTFSLSAADAPTWASFRPEMSPALFDKIEDTIRRLVARRAPGMRVGIVDVLNKANATQVLPMIRRAIDLGVDEVAYKLTELNDAARPLAPSAEQLTSIGLEMREARRLAALAGVEIHENIEFQLAHVDAPTGLYTPGLYDRVPCFAGFEMIRVRRDGAISFCCGLKFLGNAHDVSLAEHWMSPAMAAARRAALALPRGDNLDLPDGGRLRDDQCEYCYNYMLNHEYERRARESGVWHLLAGKQ